MKRTELDITANAKELPSRFKERIAHLARLSEPTSKASLFARGYDLGLAVFEHPHRPHAIEVFGQPEAVERFRELVPITVWLDHVDEPSCMLPWERTVWRYVLARERVENLPGMLLALMGRPCDNAELYAWNRLLLRSDEPRRDFRFQACLFAMSLRTTESSIGPIGWRAHSTHCERSTCYVDVPASSESVGIDDIDGGLPGWVSLAGDLRRLTERYESETDLSAKVAIREECRARARAVVAR